MNIELTTTFHLALAFWLICHEFIRNEKRERERRKVLIMHTKNEIKDKSKFVKEYDNFS